MLRQIGKQLLLILLVLSLAVGTISCNSPENNASETETTVSEETTSTAEETTTKEVKTMELNLTLNVADHLTDTFKAEGRTGVLTVGSGEGAEKHLVCDFSATGITFTAYCKGAVKVKFSTTAKTYFTVYIDEERQTNRLAVNASDSWVTVATVEEGVHTFSLIKQSQFVMSLTELVSVRLAEGYFEGRPENKAHFIQFYGDSILNGSNVYGGGTSVESSDATKGFGWVTAEKLNADCEIVGCGGLDLISTGKSYTMMTLYNQAGYNRGIAWDTARKPDVIVVELGVNSLANGVGYTDAAYTALLQQFVTALQTAYPGTPIVWMEGYHTDAKTNIAVIKAALQNYSGISYCRVDAMTGLQDSWHPGETGAKTMAVGVAGYLNRNFFSKSTAN